MKLIHIPIEVKNKLDINTQVALNDDYDDYQSYGGRYTFKAWLAHYHVDIYNMVYKES